jgi:hypothetical protein
MKLVLTILLMNGSIVTFDFYNEKSAYQCDRVFNKLTYSKNIKNYKGRKQIGTFFRNQEVLLYACETRKTV